MADKQQTILLDVKTGSGLTKTRQELQALKGDHEQIAKSLASVNKSAITADKALEQINHELAVLVRDKAVSNLATNFAKVEAETGSTRTALAELSDQLSILGASDDEIRSVVREMASLADEAERAKGASSGIRTGNQSRGQAFGDAETALRALGVGGIGTDILGGAEGLVRLKETLNDLPTAARAAVDAIGAGNLGMIGGIAAATVAIKLLQDQTEKTAAAARSQVEAQLEVSRLAATGTTESLTEQKKAAEQELEIAQAKADRANQINQQFEQDIANALNPVEQAILAFNTAIGTGGGELKATREAADQANKELAEAQSNLSAIDQALKSGNIATNDAEAAEAELAKRREDAAEKIAQLETNRAALISQAAEQQGQIDEDRRIHEEQAAEDLKDALEQQSTAHHGRMIAIADQGQQRLEQIKTQGNERLAAADVQLGKLAESLAGITTKLNADRAKVDKDYMASELAALEKFRQQEEKADAANKKARLRQLQDLNDDLLDAEQANDVVAFIARKRAGEKELRRSAQDADEATKQRQADFDAERVQAEQRRQDRIADLEAAAAERRADLEQEIIERKAARDELEKDISAQLDAEKKRIAEAEKAEVLAFEAQQKRDEEVRKKREDREQAAQDLADSRRRTALNKQLQEIDNKIAAEKNAAQLVGTAWNNMALQVGQVIGGLISNIAAQASQSVSTPASSGGSSGGGGVAFATGGIVTKPTIAKLGDRPGYHEANIPFRPSEGIEAALARLGIGGRSSPTVYFGNITVGDGVSEAQLRAGLHELAGIVIEGLDNAMRS